jgi:hypothetical protein
MADEQDKTLPDMSGRPSQHEIERSLKLLRRIPIEIQQQIHYTICRLEGLAYECDVMFTHGYYKIGYTPHFPIPMFTVTLAVFERGHRQGAPYDGVMEDLTLENMIYNGFLTVIDLSMEP